jgi:CHAD domain-containing protein
MAYRIHVDEPAPDALRRIAREQIARAVADIDDDDVDLHETVHEVRKRCKKIRGLLRLFRKASPDYAAENTAFRDAARRLSDLRDATSLLESCDALRERFEDDAAPEAFEAVRRGLLERRRERAEGLDTSRLLSETRDALEAGARRADAWSVTEDGFDAIEGGLAKVYGRARRGGDRARAEPSAENLHEWRKRVKYHRYHLRLLRDLWPDVLGPLRDEAKLLSDRLGDDHDLAILRETLVAEADRFPEPSLDAVLALLDTRRQELQAWSVPLGRKLFAETPKRFRRRLRVLWHGRRVERQLAAALPEAARRVS